jgi:hypothetical protein
MIELQDEHSMDSTVDDGLASPSPCKVVDGKPMYLSKHFGLMKHSARAVLCDVLSTVLGDTSQIHDAQSNIYR